MKHHTAVIAAIGLITANAGESHHSPASLYVLSEMTMIEGTVTDFRFNNPHVRIHFETTNADGGVESWIAEGGTPNVLLRNGWSADTFKAGDPIHIMGNPHVEESRQMIHMVTATLPDGSELYGEDADPSSAEERRRSRRR
jgi:hypothetical protein